MCIFSVGKLFCLCGAGDDASYVRFGETKKQIFKPIAQARHRNEAPKSAFWFSSSTYQYRCHIGTQPYLNVSNTEIIMCGWKDWLCCSFWISSSMNADLNVFNTCFTSRVSVACFVVTHISEWQHSHRKCDDGRPSDSSTWAATKRASHAPMTPVMWNSLNRQLNCCHSGIRSCGCSNQDRKQFLTINCAALM